LRDPANPIFAQESLIICNRSRRKSEAYGLTGRDNTPPTRQKASSNWYDDCIDDTRIILPGGAA
jgi:hypothetical protein